MTSISSLEGQGAVSLISAIAQSAQVPDVKSRQQSAADKIKAIVNQIAAPKAPSVASRTSDALVQQQESTAFDVAAAKRAQLPLQQRYFDAYRAAGNDAASMTEAQLQALDARINPTIEQLRAMSDRNYDMSSKEMSDIIYSGGGLDSPWKLHPISFKSIMADYQQGVDGYRNAGNFEEAKQTEAQMNAMQTAFDNHTLVIENGNKVPDFRIGGKPEFRADGSFYSENRPGEGDKKYQQGRYAVFGDEYGLTMVMSW